MTGLSQAESRVCRDIASRADALLSDLRRLVDIPTGPGSGGGLDEARSLLCERLARLGATVELIPGDPKPAWLGAPGPIPPTAIARRLGKGTGTRVLLAGHLDTVHAASSAFRRLDVAPGGARATGPGCVDMKGGLAIAINALEALESAGVACRWSFALNSDEETGTYHSDAALRRAAREHDVGLALEPATEKGELVVERPGSGQFMIETRGRAAHVGRDFARGVSAVNELARLILDVAALPDPTRGIIANIGPLEGGVAPNVVPDRARAWGNVRFPTPGVGAELEGRLRSMASAAGALPGVAVETSFNRPAKPLTDGTRALAELARVAAEDLGQTLPFGRTGGVCDGNNLQDAGLPTIDTLGVRGGGLHTPDEWIEIGSLVERCQLLAVVLARLAAGAFRA